MMPLPQRFALGGVFALDGIFALGGIFDLDDVLALRLRRLRLQAASSPSGDSFVLAARAAWAAAKRATGTRGGEQLT